MIYIGIDPGTHTGVAVWDSKEGRFLSLETMPIHIALTRVLAIAERHRDDVQVIFEDARLRTWFGKGNVSAKAQGAGSVKRDCSIWEDFLTDMEIPFVTTKPGNVATKVTPSWFRKLTGWEGRCSEHARDAAMLVFGR
jgi:hypothetical protein